MEEIKEKEDLIREIEGRSRAERRGHKTAVEQLMRDAEGRTKESEVLMRPATSPGFA